MYFRPVFYNIRGFVASDGFVVRGTLETLFIRHTAKLLPPISPHTMDQQGSSCCLNVLTVTSSYHSNVNLVGALDAEKLTAAVLLYVL